MTAHVPLLGLVTWPWLDQFLANHAAAMIRVALLLALGLPAVWLLARTVGRFVRRRTTEQTAMILRKLVLYTGLLIVIVSAAHQAGFQLAALLGAAGIVGIAVGFASQTSVSNIISGVFLIAEKPFAVGDVVRVGTTTGSVLSIDLLSLKLRTFDNQFVRIPNETLMKTEVVNLTRFPLRRVDTTVSVAYREDLDHVKEVLLDLARENPDVLDEPGPIVLLTSYNNSGIDFLFAVWCLKADFFKVRTTLVPAIKRRLDEAGIEIPFPHVSLYAGSKTQPLPVRLVDGSLPAAPNASDAE